MSTRMGIFDKKKGKRPDEFDSPVEQIDLSAPPEAVTEVSAQASSEAAEERAEAAGGEPEQQASQEPRSNPDYGIEQAIALMRTLPDDNVELVVRVVKHTLESTQINIGEIIKDATGKQDRIDKRIKLLKEEIGDLQKEIETRSKEIENLEEDHKETTVVKDRLQLAEKLGKDDKPKAKITTGLGGNARKKAPASIPPVGSSSKPKSPVAAKK
jgi:hypothetical protein